MPGVAGEDFPHFAVAKNMLLQTDNDNIYTSVPLMYQGGYYSWSWCLLSILIMHESISFFDIV